MIAIPVGGFCGLLVTDWLWHVSGGGNSHGEVADVLGSEALGILIGALLISMLPVVFHPAERQLMFLAITFPWSIKIG